MRLENILLKRDEIIIDRSDSNKIDLIVPIHPLIINDGLGITDKKFCKTALERALKPYYDDLKKYVAELTKKGLGEGLLKSIYLVREPTILERGKYLEIVPPGWKAGVEGNSIYTLQLNNGKLKPNKMTMIIGSDKVKFQKEKFREYMADQSMQRTKDYTGINGYAFTAEDITSIPQALMLRDWAVEYMNMYLNKLKL
jgi:hypothetical protein